MSGNCPESWDQSPEKNGRKDLASKMWSLNVNAPEFVPNFSKMNSSTGAETTAAAGSWEESGKESTMTSSLAPSSAAEVDPPTAEDVEEEVKPKIVAPAGDEAQVEKEHVNLVIIGHVDAGKSTIGGQIMALTGMVDKRTLKKYKREAKERNCESWYLSWTLDTNREEREQGKTVEVGRAYFETEKKHFVILDAPGHKNYVPNMIAGAAQADLAVLVISARKGEFESGYDRGGQTREHVLLAKMVGVRHLIVLINKMDDPTVQWCKERYDECHKKILQYLKEIGFNPKENLMFMPVSGQTGLGLKDPLSESICPWWKGPSFIQYIDNLPAMDRKHNSPFIIPIFDKYRDMGTFIMGKVEAGTCRKGQNLLLMPNKTLVVVDQFYHDNKEVNSVGPGENVKAKLKGVEEEDISPGFVLCDPTHPIQVGKIFDARIQILEIKNIIAAGYSAVMHIYCAEEEVIVTELLCLIVIDKKTGEESKRPAKCLKENQCAIIRLKCNNGVLCMEPDKIDRFSLRNEGKTVAIGKVIKIIQ